MESVNESALSVA